MICEDRSCGLTVVALVGATGQGKSWLLRQLLRRSTVANSIRSGNNLDEATELLTWIGPFPPADLDPRWERYLQCPTSEMESIGMPYLLVDAPGSTDDRQSIAAVAQRALSLASVLLLVVRRDQLRSETVALTSEASEGAIVIPVVNAVRNDDHLCVDIEAFVARMRTAAPTSRIGQPVVIDDFEMQGKSEEGVGQQAAQEIAIRLQEELGQSWDGDRRQSTRLAALDARFRSALNSILVDHLPELTGAVVRLKRAANVLPGEVAESLVGNRESLHAAIRSRLRLRLLNDTSPLCFPYRTQLGLLNLTHGAWDRLLLSLSGSLPSLVSTVWTATKNLTQDRQSNADLRSGLQQRSAAAVADRLGPLAANFREELARLREDPSPTGEALSDGSSHSRLAVLAGIDSLQERSQEIFESEVERVAPSRTFTIICGIIGVICFWMIMAGPIVTLYRQYLGTSYSSLTELSGGIDDFPRPHLATLLTSFLLSIFPTAIFSMVVLSIVQSRQKVERAEQGIRQGHREAIEKLQKSGVLRLQWDEPLLADAEFLLSAGSDRTHESGPLESEQSKAEQSRIGQARIEQSEANQ